MRTKSRFELTQCIESTKKDTEVWYAYTDVVECYASIMDADEVVADDEVDIFDENETFH